MDVTSDVPPVFWKVTRQAFPLSNDDTTWIAVLPVVWPPPPGTEPGGHGASTMTAAAPGTLWLTCTRNTTTAVTPASSIPSAKPAGLLPTSPQPT